MVSVISDMMYFWWLDDEMASKLHKPADGYKIMGIYQYTKSELRFPLLQAVKHLPDDRLAIR